MKKLFTVIIALTMTLCLFAGCATESKTAAPAAPAISKTWAPKGNVQILSAGAPGGDQDLGARLYAEYLSKYWGVNVVVVNIAGDASAMYTLHDAQPDGNTIMFYNDAFLLNIANKSVDFGVDDITIAGVAGQLDGQVLVSRKALGWKTLDDLKTACAAKPDSHTVSIAYSKTTRIMGEMLVAAGIQCRLVDSDGGPDRIAKLLGGFVDAAYLSYDSCKDYIKSGEFDVLAIVQEKRSDVCPDIKTAVEQGYDVVFPTTFYMLLPKDVSPEILEGWSTALKALNADPEFIKAAPKKCLGLQAKYVAPADLRPYLDKIYGYAEKYLGKK